MTTILSADYNVGRGIGELGVALLFKFSNLILCCSASPAFSPCPVFVNVSTCSCLEC